MCNHHLLWSISFKANVLLSYAHVIPKKNISTNKLMFAAKMWNSNKKCDKETHWKMLQKTFCPFNCLFHCDCFAFFLLFSVAYSKKGKNWNQSLTDFSCRKINNKFLSLAHHLTIFSVPIYSHPLVVVAAAKDSTLWKSFTQRPFPAFPQKKKIGKVWRGAKLYLKYN